MLRARAYGETLVSATMCPQQFVLVCLTSQIEAPTSPRATPRAFEFLENFLFKFPPPRAEKLFKCHHPRENYQITV